LFSVFTYSQYFIIQDKHSGSKLFFSIVDAILHISVPIKISNTNGIMPDINCCTIAFSAVCDKIAKEKKKEGFI
jgi:hypothetical protein